MSGRVHIFGTLSRTSKLRRGRCCTDIVLRHSPQHLSSTLIGVLAAIQKYAIHSHYHITKCKLILSTQKSSVLRPNTTVLPQNMCYYLSLLPLVYNTSLASDGLRPNYFSTRPQHTLSSMIKMSGTIVVPHEPAILDERTPRCLVCLICVLLEPSLTTESAMLTSWSATTSNVELLS